jgi:hypothetical protein
MASITPQQFRDAYARAAAASNPAHVANANRHIINAADGLDPDDNSAGAQILRGIAEDIADSD